MPKQPALCLNEPPIGVICKSTNTCRAYDTVAGDDKRQRICAARLADSACDAAEIFRNCLVLPYATGRDCADLRPDLPLKYRTLRADGQIELGVWIGEIGRQLRRETLTERRCRCLEGKVGRENVEFGERVFAFTHAEAA